MPTTVLFSQDGRLDADNRQRFDALKGRLASGTKKVLLHLHGGLVKKEDGEKIAAALSGTGPLAFNAPEDYEQIYIVWRTGALETIRTNWKDLFDNDRLYRALLKRLIGYVSSKIPVEDGSGRSVGLVAGLSLAEIDRRLNSGSDAPFADLDETAARDMSDRAIEMPEVTDAEIRGELGTALKASAEFSAAVEDLAAAVSWDAEGRSTVTVHGDAARGRASFARLQRDIRGELEAAPDSDEGRGLIASAALLKVLVKHGVAIAIRVIRRLRDKRGHGIYATIVEEIARELYGDLIGSAIWGMMKNDANDHFGANGLGGELLDLFEVGNHRLVVTGHSAGSIWASAMLIAAAKMSSFPKFTLVLLAPAVRMVEFAAALKVASLLLERFRIFAMSDALERADAVLGKGLGAIYPSSLLYLVSGLFEETAGQAAPDAPLLGMQRFLDRAPDWLDDQAEAAAITQVRAFLGGIANASIYSKANGGAGLSTDATSHGGFDNNTLTLESVHTFL